jgi:hypothetical protein
VNLRLRWWITDGWLMTVTIDIRFYLYISLVSNTKCVIHSHSLHSIIYTRQSSSYEFMSNERARIHIMSENIPSEILIIHLLWHSCSSGNVKNTSWWWFLFYWWWLNIGILETRRSEEERPIEYQGEQIDSRSALECIGTAAPVQDN